MLLIYCEFSSAFSSCLLREKKDAFDAVIGVLGVLVLTRRGGGVTCPSENEGSCKAAILVVVGVLKGSRFRGGSRSGCKFFFFAVIALFCWSRSELEVTEPYWRFCGSRSFLTGSRTEALPDKLVVEELFILLASNGILDFRLLRKGGSAGDSLGDSYALGIAGTGGTSSSSLFPAELCTLLDLGVGNLDDVAGSVTLDCRAPVDVRALLQFVLDVMERPEL